MVSIFRFYYRKGISKRTNLDMPRFFNNMQNLKIKIFILKINSGFLINFEKNSNFPLFIDMK